MQATFNKVSDCCHRPIVFKYGREFPLGGVSWGISIKEPVCECCGKDCGEVDQCEICGIVGCLGGCEVPVLKEVPCGRCKGLGYHHGFGSDGHDPDYCVDCGGNGVDFVDISEGEDEV